MREAALGPEPAGDHLEGFDATVHALLLGPPEVPLDSPAPRPSDTAPGTTSASRCEGQANASIAPTESRCTSSQRDFGWAEE